MSAPKRPYKSTAREWKGAKRAAQRYRDRKTVTLPDGSSREFLGYGPTKGAATDDLYDKIARAFAERPSGETITFTQLLAKVVTHKRRVKGRKRKTIHNDIDLYNRHIKPHIGSKRLAEIGLADLQAIQYRLTSQGTYRTAELATILLKSCYKHAMKLYRQQILEGTVRLANIAEDLDSIQPPAGHKPKRRKDDRPERPWTADELEAFLAAARARYEKSIRNLYYPLFHTAIAAGLRRGELLGLQRSALKYRSIRTDGRKRRQYYLEITEQFVFYDGKHHHDTPKTPNSTREVPIGLLLARILRQHIRKLARVAERNKQHARNNLLFPGYNGRPIDPHNLYRTRDELIEQLDLPHSTLHQMRKAYATYVTRDLIRRGKYSPKVVQALLGHSRPDVALQVYTQVIEEDYNTATFDPVVPRKPKEEKEEQAA